MRGADLGRQIACNLPGPAQQQRADREPAESGRTQNPLADGRAQGVRGVGLNAGRQGGHCARSFQTIWCPWIRAAVTLCTLLPLLQLVGWGSEDARQRA
jgi:hypothetical protein